MREYDKDSAVESREQYVSDFLDALSNAYRRETIRVLLEEKNRKEITVDEIGSRLEQNTSLDGDQNSINLDLHHRHLPKLDEIDGIRYNDEGTTSTVEYNLSPQQEKNLTEALKLADEVALQYHL